MFMNNFKMRMIQLADYELLFIVTGTARTEYGVQ